MFIKIMFGNIFYKKPGDLYFLFQLQERLLQILSSVIVVQEQKFIALKCMGLVD